MPYSSTGWTVRLLVSVVLVAGQQQCYFGPGASNRGPASLVPCANDGQSACCLLGDTCLSNSVCYNFATGDLYQYGCTDITYTNSVCPYKCGWNTSMLFRFALFSLRSVANLEPALSPWTALEYCTDLPNVTNTWTCHAPESCGCQWNSTPDLLVLSPRGCKEMGSNARVAMSAPSKIAPFVSLPSTVGGSTGYYSFYTNNGTTTWVETAVSGCKPGKMCREYPSR